MVTGYGRMLRTGETWRPIAGFEGLYDVSDLGRLRSHHRGRATIKQPSSDPDDYPVAVLYGKGKPKGVAVHRLVALAFKPEGRNALHCEVAHLDGDRANARADNLKWVSKVENHSHRKAHGTAPMGERHPRAVLSEDDVRRILVSRDTANQIAASFGISRHTVADIRRGKRWRHLTSIPFAWRNA